MGFVSIGPSRLAPRSRCSKVYFSTHMSPKNIYIVFKNTAYFEYLYFLLKSFEGQGNFFKSFLGKKGDKNVYSS